MQIKELNTLLRSEDIDLLNQVEKLSTCESKLINKIKNTIPKNFEIQYIDDYGIDGDFVESQAFAYLSIRTFLKLPVLPSITCVANPA